jgi:hypothetical protein
LWFCHGLIGMAGIRLFQISDSLTELHLDNSQMYILSRSIRLLS